MNDKGIFNESEMLNRTCKFIRVVRENRPQVPVNREAPYGTTDYTDNLGMQNNWDKCEGCRCAHWRWYRKFPWSKVAYGGLGFCGLAGKP